MIKSNLIRRYVACAAAMLFFATTPIFSAVELKRSEGGFARLHIDGQPFVILGGELMNSSGSTSEDMLEKWDCLKAINLNTVLLAVAWDQVEKEEGQFDFAQIKSIIKQAQERNMKLVLLWFGSWKNGVSGYAPHWVMRDTKRFPRMKSIDGKNRPVLSNLSAEVLKSDKRAFLEFIKAVKETDPQADTVIMIQIENEIGLLDASRDHSEVADKAFKQNVPHQLIKYIHLNSDSVLPEILSAWKNGGKKENGSWEETFGQKNRLADDMFMAWHYARFVNELAKEAKAIHPLPMFVNAWVISPDNPPPGKYPSGGPTHRMLDVWKVGAPEIDFFAVDNYMEDFAAKTKQFFRAGNPIFTPEACALWLGDYKSAGAKAFYTIGEFGAIGFSPFGIDHKTYSTSHPISTAYKALKNLTPAIAKAQAQKDMHGFMQQTQNIDTLDFGDVEARVEYTYTYKGFGLIIRLSKEEFLISGSGFDVKFYTKNSISKDIAGYGLIEEGEFVNGEWKTNRYLGGDEAFGGIGGVKIPAVYLKSDADESMVKTVRVKIFKSGNSTDKNTLFL